MSSKERFLTALKGETPDRVPIFDFPFSRALQKKIIGYETELYDGKAVVEIANKLGLDGVPIFFGGYCGIEFFKTKGNKYTDDWGIEYLKKGWPIISQIKNPITGRKDWENYNMPDPSDEWRFEQVKAAIKANTKNKAIIGCIRGPVSMLSWFLLRIDILSYNFIDDPSLIEDICNSFIDWSLELVNKASKINGLDAFLIADDWGMTKSLLISPAYLKKFFLKPYSRLVSEIRSLGYPVIMHNDGNIWEILDELVATGINACHPVEKAAFMDLKKVKEKYKKRLCPIGNIDNKKILVKGTEDDVKNETLRCLRERSIGGGYIISSDHSLHDDIPHQNVFSYINVAKEYGAYKEGKLELE